MARRNPTITLENLLQDLPKRLPYYEGILNTKASQYQNLIRILQELGSTNKEIRTNESFLRLTENLSAQERKEISNALVQLSKERPKMVTENQLESFVENPTKDKAKELFEDIITRGEKGISNQISNLENKDALLNAFKSVEEKTTLENFETTPNTSILLTFTFGKMGVKGTQKEQMIVGYEEASKKAQQKIKEIEKREGAGVRVFVESTLSPLLDKIKMDKKVDVKREIGEEKDIEETTEVELMENLTSDYINFLENKTKGKIKLQKLTPNFLPSINNRQLGKNNIVFQSYGGGYIMNPYLKRLLSIETTEGNILNNYFLEFAPKQQQDVVLSERDLNNIKQELDDNDIDILMFEEIEIRNGKALLIPNEVKRLKESISELVDEETKEELLEKLTMDLPTVKNILKTYSDFSFSLENAQETSDLEEKIRRGLGSIHMAARYYDELDSFDKKDWDKYEQELSKAIYQFKEELPNNIEQKVEDLVNNPEKYTQNVDALFYLLKKNNVIRGEVEDES